MSARDPTSAQVDGERRGARAHHTDRGKRRSFRIAEARTLLWLFAVSIPPALAAIAISTDHAQYAWIWIVAALALSAGIAVAARNSLVRRMRTVSSVIASYREGDFSIRARNTHAGPLSDVVTELNQLGDMLREQRLGAMEAWALLR